MTGAPRTGDEDQSMETMSIGDFARATGLSAKALRLYDEMGLLPPAVVDPFSGYRSYSPDQLDRARLVARLRLVGMPLARIRSVADLPPRAAAAELASYGRQLAADTASARQLLEVLVAELDLKENDMTTTQQHPAQAAFRGGVGARDSQRDAVRSEPGVYAVADGCGDGPAVARSALDALAGIDLDNDALTALDRAVADAAAAVVQAAEGSRTAATTLTALVLDGDQALLAHVGDSRAYRVREGRLERLTRDHTVVQTLVDEGSLTAEEARSDERRPLLNRALALDAPGQPDLMVLEARPGDRFVLTTDGVHAVLEPTALTALLVAEVSPEEVAASVEAAVVAGGAPDNYHVLVVDLAG